MSTEKFILEGNAVIEIKSGMRLLAVPDDEILENAAWICGWFKVASGRLVIQKFIILNIEQATYRSASQALDFWGFQVLGVSESDAVEMSPEIGKTLLITAVRSKIAQISL
jgi:hypothetical protein